MPKYQIFAKEGRLLFDSFYARNTLKLPFRVGWSRYHVYKTIGQDLEFCASFSHYESAEDYVKACH